MLAILMVWPLSPLIEQVEIGKQLASRGRGPERTLREDRQVLGKWWDGRVYREADIAILISPAFVSRWIGWQAKKEGAEPEEVQQRWLNNKARFENGTTIVVRLAELDRVDPLDFGLDKQADPETHKALRWSISFLKTYPKPKGVNTVRPVPTFVAKAVPETSILLFKQGYEANELLDIAWFQTGDWMGSLKPAGARDPEPGLPLGSNSIVWYLIKAPRMPANANCIELRVVGNGKERIARFDG